MVDEVRDGRLWGVWQRLLLLLLHVLWDQNRERLYFGIVIRVDAHFVLLQVVRKLQEQQVIVNILPLLVDSSPLTYFTMFHGFHLVLALQVWPAPQATVYDVRNSFAWR